MRVLPYGEALALGQQDVETRFELADALVRRSFRQLVEQGDVLGAFPFGSTQFNDHNTLSDYDIMVMIPESNASRETYIFAQIHQAAVGVYRQTQVPLEVSCYTDKQIQAGEHSIPERQASWLREQREGQPHNVIGADFVPALDSPRFGQSLSGLGYLDDYIARTRHVLIKSWMQGDYLRPHDLLSLVLGVPHVAGRRILDKLQHRLSPDVKTVLPDMEKETIAQAAIKFYGAENEIYSLYADVNADARRYEELVGKIHELSEDEYDQIVRETLEQDLPKTIELLRRMQEDYRQRFNQTAGYEEIRMHPYVERGSNMTGLEAHRLYITAVRAAQENSW